MSNFRSLDDQVQILNIDELKRKREPEKTDQRITNLIKSIESTKRHNTQIVHEDDFEYFQWFNRKKTEEENQKTNDERLITEKFKVT